MKRKKESTQATRLLAQWAARVPGEWSAIARERAGHAVEDIVGCMVAGAGDAGTAATWAGTSEFGHGAATVIGRSRPVPAAWAALVNGYAAHAVEMDDNFYPSLGHPTAVLIPALFALGEEVDASGGAIIDAYLVGLEVMARLGLGIGRGHTDRGWHGTSTIGAIGTAAACGRLLAFDERDMLGAISLAVSMAAGPKGQFGSLAKPLHCGLAAKAGVISARFAQSGLYGSSDIVEADMGFSGLYGGEDVRHWEQAHIGVDEPHAIEKWGLLVKRHPCCASTHRVLDAVIDMKNAHGFSADDVESVDALIGFSNTLNLQYDNPETEREARFSLQYCVAVALRNGCVRLSDFVPASVGRPEIRRLLPLTKIQAYPREAESVDPASRKPHRTTIKLKDGTTYASTVQWARGSISNPFSAEDREDKFRSCCSCILAPKVFTRVKSLVESFGTLKSITELTRELDFDAGCDTGERFSAGEPPSARTGRS